MEGSIGIGLLYIGMTVSVWPYRSNPRQYLMKKKLCYKEVPSEKSWLIHLGKELLKVQNGCEMVLPGFSKEPLKFVVQAEEMRAPRTDFFYWVPVFLPHCQKLV